MANAQWLMAVPRKQMPHGKQCGCIETACAKIHLIQLRAASRDVAPPGMKQSAESSLFSHWLVILSVIAVVAVIVTEIHTRDSWAVLCNHRQHGSIAMGILLIAALQVSVMIKRRSVRWCCRKK
jgi:hypothetical protein